MAPTEPNSVGEIVGQWREVRDCQYRTGRRIINYAIQLWPALTRSCELLNFKDYQYIKDNEQI